MSLFFKKRPADFVGDLQVVTCFLDFLDHFLLVKYGEHSPVPHKWAVPGGKVEKNETINQALERELKEELSIDFLDWTAVQHLRRVYVRHSKADYLLHIYHWVLEQKPQILIAPEEHSEYIWIHKNCLREIDLIEGQFEAFKLALEKDETILNDLNDVQSCK